MTSLSARAQANWEALRANPYPGRGLVIGLTPDAAQFVQVYWIMGRSENSRNRVFVAEGDVVRTAPFDPAKVKDPSLIIYNCARVCGRAHIVSNGDQTDTIFETLRGGGTFEQALYTRCHEPDAPNYTPRIAGLTALDDPRHAYQLAVLKALNGQADWPARQVFSFGRGAPGFGHFVATYRTDGDPLPAFEGEPQLLALPQGLDETLERYWNALNAENRVALMVKTIDRASGRWRVGVVNRHA